MDFSREQLLESLELARRRFFFESIRPAVRTAAEYRLEQGKQGGAVSNSPRDIDNILGIGIGRKQVLNGAKPVGCVRLYVRKKFALAEIPAEYRLPDRIGEVPTDVIQAGRISSRTCTKNRQKHQQRPVPAGVSCGHPAITAGTIGVRVRSASGRGFLLLSNNHVLADCNRAAVGDLILQPGPEDGGKPGRAAHAIGKLKNWVPLDFSGGYNWVDAAVASTTASKLGPAICSLGKVTGVTSARANLAVQKHGRTTGLTMGVVEDIDAEVWVDYEDVGVALFTKQIAIVGADDELFSDGGDSGSLIVDLRKRACGLLFAGSDSENLTFANPIRRVLRDLQISLSE